MAIGWGTGDAWDLKKIKSRSIKGQAMVVWRICDFEATCPRSGKEEAKTIRSQWVDRRKWLERFPFIYLSISSKQCAPLSVFHSLEPILFAPLQVAPFTYKDPLCMVAHSQLHMATTTSKIQPTIYLFDWIDSNWIESNWTELNQIELNRIRLNGFCVKLFDGNQ